MTTRLYFHPACLAHDPAPLPGFAPARLQAVINALRGPAFEALEWVEPMPALQGQLTLVHTSDYVESVLAPVVPGEQKAFDFETFAMSATGEAALASAGAVLDAVAAVAGGEARNAFCLASPGGHHAEAEMAQGYCFFNPVALAARRFAGRVAVLDFDAHHGNGTQSLFWSHPDCLLVSLHEDVGLSGFAHERGAYDNILNLPLPPHSDGAVFRAAVETQALPKIAAFEPHLLVVSAGFDMHRADPLSSLMLDVADYGWLGERLAACADVACAGRMVAVLEGGYDLDALAASVAAFVCGMMKEASHA
jgi:acetoin utilization deacetylase AcuC-like enzyme